MTVGSLQPSIRQDKHVFLTGTVIVLFVYLADNLIDSLLEGESFVEQVLSAPRLALLICLVAGAFYLLRMASHHRALKLSSTLQLAAIESSTDGIAIFDADGRLTYSNTAHTALYGYDNAEELVGKNWRFFFGEDEVEKLQQEENPSLPTSGNWRGETVGNRKDGSKLPLDVSLTRLKNGGFIRIVRDNTEKKTCELQLEHKAQALAATNNELKSFSYSLSHDIRSRIARVSSAVQLLADNYALAMDDDGKFLVDSIDKAAGEMEQLIESIEMLASISQSRLRLEVVDISRMIATIAADLRLRDPNRDVDFVIAPDVCAFCDHKLARVALENLLNNAWKYTGLASPARIEFGAECDGDRTLLFIRDNGMGFKPEDTAKLFTPFTRLEEARNFPGTGVGLATVRRVIQLHDGELRAIGEPGKGATFYFSFNRQAEP